MRIEALTEVSVAEEQRWNDVALERVDALRAALWRYREPGVVLGRAQRELLPDVRSRGWTAVARASGGAAVLTGPWLMSASVVIPRGHPASRSVPSAFSLVAHAYLGALAGLGAGCVLAQTVDGGAPPVSWACFGSTTAHEIVTPDGRKLVGVAQTRRASGTMVVAGLLLAEPPWGALCDAMGESGADADVLRRRTTSLEAILGCVPSTEELAMRIAAALRSGAAATARVRGTAA